MLGLVSSLFFAVLGVMVQMMFWSLRMTLFLFRAMLQVFSSLTAEAGR